VATFAIRTEQVQAPGIACQYEVLTRLHPLGTLDNGTERGLSPP